MREAPNTGSFFVNNGPKWPRREVEVLRVVKNEEQAETCPIRQETMTLMSELQLMGQLRLIEIIEQVVAGQHELALCSVRVVRQQLGSCQESWRLFERVNRLVYAAICPHVAEELKGS